MKKSTFWNILLLTTILGMSMQSYANQKINIFDGIVTKAEKSTAAGNLPVIIDNAGENRGAGFNGEYMFVASRTSGNHVYYWDVNAPAEPAKKLSMTGVAGGTFTVSDLAVVGNNIFVSNMAFAGGNFKVYHWDGVDAEPTVLIDLANAPARLGDAISIVGDPSFFASLIVSGHGSANFYVWNIELGALVSPEPEVFSFEGIASANFSRATWAIGDYDYSIISGPFGMAVVEDTSTEEEEANPEVALLVPQSFFPGWPMYVQVFEYKGGRYLSFVHVTISTTPAQNMLYVLNITEGANTLEAIQNLIVGTFAEKVVHSVNLGSVSNGNASVGHDVVIDPFGNLWLMGYAAGNGFVVQKLGNATGVTLPYVQNFEGEGAETPETWLPEGWMNVDADGDGDTWIWESSENDEGVLETYMRSFSYAKDVDNNDVPLTPDNWLISPAILLPNLDFNEAIKVMFEVSPTASAPEYRMERYEILISTTDTDTSSFTMLWEETFKETDERWVWQPKELDISDYQGGVVYLAIRHQGSTFLESIVLNSFSVSVETFVATLADLTLNVKMRAWAELDKFKPETDFVDVAGTFNGWGETPLVLTAKNDADLTYTVTIPDLTIDQQYRFKFRINGTWNDATAEFPFSGPERVVTIKGDGNNYTFWYNNDQPSSVDNLDANNYSIFPNPAQSHFNVQSVDMINMLRISDITGRTIQQISVNAHETRVDLSSFKNGVYIISLFTENGVTINKLQIQK